MNIKSHIPNFVTILNLLSGSLSIILLFKGLVIEAALLVGLASIFDFLDGYFARLLHVKSLIGKELDSLADTISFGLAPSLFLFFLLNQNSVVISSSGLIKFTPYLALIIVSFSALRLGKFNIDTRQLNSFLGLPTPASAMLIIPLVVVALTSSNVVILSIIGNYWFQLSIIPIVSYLLVSEIPMFALKFNSGFSLKSNYKTYSFMLGSLILIIILGWLGISLAIVLYIIMSIVLRGK